MKKSLLGLAAICGTVFAGVETASVNSTHEGWYLGAGVNYQHTTCKVTQSDYLGNAQARAYPGYNGYELVKSNVGKVGGCVTAGYGALLGGCYYLGAELTLDIVDDQKHSYKVEDKRFSEGGPVTAATLVNTKVMGFVPTVALRAGWFATSIDTLFYVRAGGAYIQTKVDAVVETTRNDGRKVSFNPTDLNKKRVDVVVGAGFERGVCEHWNVRLEGDYRISSSKEGDGVTRVPGAWIKFKNKSDGYAVRLFVTHVF